MNYYLYKLKFDTAVHFGPSFSAGALYSSENHFCADTLFSALCHTALALGGRDMLAELCRQAEEGNILLSDSMPWMGETFYLPKPFITAKTDRTVTITGRKAAKKLKWIPADDLDAFFDYIYGGDPYEAEKALAQFGISTGTTKVRITPGEDALPYQVGLYYFKEDAGLWFLAGCETDLLADDLQTLVEGLSFGGIGGKVSSGYGKFHIEDLIYLNEPFDTFTERLFSALKDASAKRQLLLSTSLPSEDELTDLLPDSEYMLTRRAGFIQSGACAQENRRKVTQLFLSAGSVLPKRFKAVLYEVGKIEEHPVYRLSAPLFLGVRP
ncbi:MAG: type III-A CRISPR-associated RAMP protein Csm4 [Clostridia bacterium]|nr:type III-A CRISPR-associated RAMP protein Csm4 [Clostridia bacterium]